jgi:hypothetical protein
MIKNPQKSEVFHHKLLFTIVFYDYIERVSSLEKDDYKKITNIKFFNAIYLLI